MAPHPPPRPRRRLRVRSRPLLPLPPHKWRIRPGEHWPPCVTRGAPPTPRPSPSPAAASAHRLWMATTAIATPATGAHGWRRPRASRPSATALPCAAAARGATTSPSRRTRTIVVGTTSAIWMRYARTLAQRISRWRSRGSQSHPAWTAARTVLLLQARVAAAQDGGVGGGVRSGRGPTQLPPRHAASPACVGPLGVEESATREQATPAARGRPRRKRLRLSPTARLPAVLVLAAPTYRTRGLSAIAPGSASATCRTSAGRLPTASTT